MLIQTRGFARLPVSVIMNLPPDFPLYIFLPFLSTIPVNSIFLLFTLLFNASFTYGTLLPIVEITNLPPRGPW